MLNTKNKLLLSYQSECLPQETVDLISLIAKLFYWKHNYNIYVCFNSAGPRRQLHYLNLKRSIFTALTVLANKEAKPCKTHLCTMDFSMETSTRPYCSGYGL